jgi:hypothetical protein
MYVMISGSRVKVKVRSRDLAKLRREQLALREAILAEARKLPWWRRVWYALFPPRAKARPAGPGTVSIRQRIAAQVDGVGQ